MSGKPTNQGVAQLKFQSKRTIAEERTGRKLGGLRVINSYGINVENFFEHCYSLVLKYHIVFTPFFFFFFFNFKIQLASTVMQY